MPQSKKIDAMRAHQIRIIKTSSETLHYLNAIQAATDANRNSLGFMPVAAYEDALMRGKIWVAVDGADAYLGHIMCGGNFSTEIRIFQVHVDENSRGIGVGALLLKELTEHAEALGCLNLRADVASDLSDAMKFWQSQNFTALTQRKKKNSSGREVLLFYKRLSTPSLLPQETLPLNISAAAVGKLPDTYVFDINILLTLMRGRPNEKLVSEIMKAAMAGEFNLFITPEFKKELERQNKKDNPMLDLADKVLPILKQANENDIIKLQEEIREIVFPKRSRVRKNARQDESDLRHLAYCIHLAIEGFITEEKTLLAAKERLSTNYGLTVFSPEDFKIEHFGGADISLIDVPLQSDGHTMSISNVQKNSDTSDFLNSLGDSLPEVSQLVQKNNIRGIHERKLVYTNDQASALYFTQTLGTKHDVLEGYFITSSNLENRDVVFNHILESFMRLAQAMKAQEIFFHVQQKDFDLENICLEKGFKRSASGTSTFMRLTKTPCPLLVTRANWEEFREHFYKSTDINLPRLIPNLHVDNTKKPVVEAACKGRPYQVSLYDLESFLSPSLLLLPKRTGVIIPIAPTYASSLLARTEGTLPFAEREEALLRLEKAYFRKPSHANIFVKGMPIIFYESGKGRGAIGAARITSVMICNHENAFKLYRRFGVLNEAEIKQHKDKNGNVQIITFDNFKVFSQPISMKKMKEIGCCKANLVGPEKLPYSQLYQMLHEGLSISAKDVILSIQPEYVTQILNGKKTVELRKKPFPANGNTRVWIYSTSPTSAIEATATVLSVQKETPSKIWRDLGSKCGISKADFDAYFAGSDEAYALHLSNPLKLKKKLKLDEIKSHFDGFYPPQYYRYVEHDSDLFFALVSEVG